MRGVRWAVPRAMGRSPILHIIQVLEPITSETPLSNLRACFSLDIFAGCLIYYTRLWAVVGACG